VQALGLSEELLPLHRLDAGTEGLVVLAKDRDFARRFCPLLSRDSGCASQRGRGRLEKTYRALAARPVACGRVSHWARVNAQGVGEPAFTRILAAWEEGAVRCELEVLEVRCCAVQIPVASLPTVQASCL
jgi:23S rRNA-/tRNA-specific pseudouridylate synthase